MRRPTIRSLAAILLVVVAACVSPTLPLPPPDAPANVVESTEDPGSWLVRGGCTPGAVVLVQNAATGRIFGVEDANADGRYTVSVQGSPCDLAEVWEIVGDVSSDRTGFLLVTTVNGAVEGQACAKP